MDHNLQSCGFCHKVTECQYTSQISDSSRFKSYKKFLCS